MKKYIVCAGLIATFFGACRRSDAGINGKTYSGHVVTDVCGNVAVQFTDGTQMGQDWTTSAGVQYKNIFKVSNACTWRPKNGKTADIKFIEVPPTPQNCAVCMIAVEMPTAEYSIQVVE